MILHMLEDVLRIDTIEVKKKKKVPKEGRCN